jgi:nitrogen regulatory protein P-II 1
MIKVEAIIQPSRFEMVKKALIEAGVEGMSVLEVRGHGKQKGHTDTYRGHEYKVDLLPKIRLDIIIDDSMKDTVVDAITKAAATGKIGDGKIFLFKVEEAIRIRDKAHGVAAL